MNTHNSQPLPEDDSTGVGTDSRAQQSAEKKTFQGILDEVLESQQEAGLEEFDPSRIIALLLNDLPMRSKTIIQQRYSLDGTSVKTLEELGKLYNITRERVRQIESAALKSLFHPEKQKHLKPLTKMLTQLLYQHGEIMQEERLIDFLLGPSKDSERNRKILYFLLQLVSDVNEYPESKEFRKSWGLTGRTLEKPRKVIEHFTMTLNTHGTVLHEEMVLERLVDHPEIKPLELKKDALLGYLHMSKTLHKNPFNEWGLTEWVEVMPRGVRDKAYIVLKKFGKPAHFTKIADMINEQKFDDRTAHPQTVHNELIKDQRFILVGRGMYGLSEWGYKPGTVADVLTRILKEKGPMEREALVDAVLEERVIKRNTVLIALQNKKKFRRNADGTYSVLATEVFQSETPSHGVQG